MTQPNNPPHFLVATLAAALDALLAGCPVEQEYAEVLAEISELAARLPAAPDREKHPETRLSTPQALSLAEMTLDSAITLTDLAGGDGPVPGAR